ncbi:hypothetical protein C5S53_14505 [Methanophagales archaeon]|jgi:hypothetical protein|nr:hypothetical protein C5S53_14505 [Methanophagales archaeon]
MKKRFGLIFFIAMFLVAIAIRVCVIPNPADIEKREEP